MNNQKNHCILPALLFIIALFYSATARADMYKYVGDNGTVSITDDLGKIPEKYRAKSERIKEEKVQVVTLPAAAPSAENVAVKNEAAPPTTWQTTVASKKTTESPLKFSEYDKKTLIIGAAATIVFLVALIVILNKCVKNRMVTRLIFFLIMAAVGIVVYKMYAENVYKQFSAAKKSAEDAKKLIEQQQKEQLKGLGDLGK